MSTFLNSFVLPLIRTPKRLLFTMFGLLIILAMIDPLLVSDLIDVVAVSLWAAFGPLIEGLIPIAVLVGGFMLFWQCLKPKKTEPKKKPKGK